MDVLGNTDAPSTSIDACLSDGFHLDNGIKIAGGDGVLLVAGEAFTWRPWEVAKEGGGGQKKGQGLLVNKKGQFEVEDEAWGVFGLVWPKPGELCISSFDGVCNTQGQPWVFVCTSILGSASLRGKC